MDKKITELKETEGLTGFEYIVVASQEDAENYKVKVSDFAEDAIDVDDALSETSENPVQNKVITSHINDLEDRLETVEDTTGRLLDLSVAQVDTYTLNANEKAKVEILDLGTDETDTKSLAFKFYIPRGAIGQQGEQGITGTGGRTVFAFKHSEEKPETPTGGSWNPVTNEITYPEGWSPTDNLESPIWMSNATFDEFKLVIDWSEPIQVTGADGAAGADGTSIEFIFKLAETENTVINKPTNKSNITDYVPRDEGWEDHPQGVSQKYLCEYVCTRTKNKETNLWNDWTGPALWSKYGANGKDGDGVEYIYMHNTGATPSNPTPADITTDEYQSKGEYEGVEYVPSDWYDNPQGVDSYYTHEWVCVRKRRWDVNTNEQKWSEFSDPSLWGKYGRDGENGQDGLDGQDGKDGKDGQGITLMGSYDSYSELVTAWENGTLKGSNPPVVGDSYLINGEVWIFDGDDFMNGGSVKGPQGDPGKDGQDGQDGQDGLDGISMYIHIKYSDDIVKQEFTNNDGEEIGKYIGVRVDYVEKDSSVFSDYTWSLFRGNDGFGYEYIFMISDGTTYTPTNPPTVPTEITDTDVAPTGWTDDPTGVSVNYPYEFCCYRKSDADGNWGAWRGKKNSSNAWLFAMYAEAISIPGETGKPGPIPYPAGIWGDPHTSFEQDGYYNNDGEWVATTTPYVWYNGVFYILTTKESGTTAPNSNSSWTDISMFEAIYTDILLANNAKVGQAIFNGNYMFSQKGEGSGTYTDFNANDPYADSNSFKPNWCVNLYTGEMWTGCGTTYFNNDGTGHIGDWYLRNVEGSGVSLEGVIGTGKNVISLMPWSGIKVTGTEYGEAVSLNIDGSGHLGSGVQWNADGSGSLANGAIQWDKDGNITVYPKSEAGTATISGEWNDTNYSEATVRISISSNYGTISECKVVLYDYAYGNGTIGEASFNASAGSTFSDTILNAAGIPCWAQLHINGEMVAENQLLPYVSK